ncbi:hypothetical protein [Halospeciosus flavus]|uniref:DUF8054 domain-containing protein n=1 Tax=Halospeciosus flavus TaxID=3032283 RepID=A0ABD5Z5S5_9EURY|nr:hypothetical protein [Halospeciosus flavus]
MSATGDLVFSRVLPDVGTALTLALDRTFTGRAEVTPQSSLLLDGDGDGVATVAFDAGVPTHVRHDDGRNGPDAVAALAVAGPSLVELYETTGDASLGTACRVAATTPATNLADEALVERTRAAAPDDTGTRENDASDDGLAAVEAFLADGDAIAELQTRAREEAERRAAEWGFDAGAQADTDAATGPEPPSDPG